MQNIENTPQIGQAYQYPLSGVQNSLHSPIPTLNAQIPSPPNNPLPLPNKLLIDPNCPNLNYHNQMIFFQIKSTRILFYDFSSKKWIPGLNSNEFTFLSFFRTAQLPDGSILLTGGSDLKDIIYNTVVLYHIDGYIIAKKEMKLARRAHSSIFNNGYVYVFGGVNNKGFLQDCERYNLKDGVWNDIDKMSKKRTLTSCCNFNSDTIFVFGGYCDFEKKELNLIERYDLKTNKFYTMNFKMVDRLQNPFVVQINPMEILIMGGYNDDIGDSDNAYLMNVYKGEFRKMENLTEKGWGVYPPVFSGGFFCLFMTGEDPEAPDCIEYFLKS